MLILLILMTMLLLLPLVIGILLGRWRPGWSFLKVATIAALPLPLIVAVLGLVAFRDARAFPAEVLVYAGAVLTTLFVLGVLAGAIGAWLASRPQRLMPLDAHIEDVFR